MKFVVEGEITREDAQRRFTKEIEADSESRARELTYNFFGSRQGIKRGQVKIASISKL